MQVIKKLLLTLGLITLTACSSQDENSIKVGTISGPETTLMETAKDVARTHGLNIKIVEFTDYLQPNAALNEGSIDANMFQHQPYLDKQIKDKSYNLISVAKTFVYPMGIYSKKIKNFADLKPKSIVAIPNDPSNEGRALLLLEKTGLIKLKKNAGLYATPKDIAENPKKLKFKELDASQGPRSLPDVALAVINTNYAVVAGLSPSKDALALEDKTSPYANIIAVQKGRENDDKIKQLVESFQSTEVRNKAKELFKDQAIIAW